MGGHSAFGYSTFCYPRPSALDLFFLGEVQPTKVTSQQLQWGAASFVKAKAIGTSFEVARDLSLAFKHSSKRGRAKRAKKKEHARAPSRNAKEEAEEDLSESEAESDTSLLDALARVLDGEDDNEDLLDPDNARAEAAEENRESRDDLIRLASSVAASSKYATGCPTLRATAATTPPASTPSASGADRKDLDRLQEVEEALRAHTVKEAIDTLSNQSNKQHGPQLNGLEACMHGAMSAHGGLLSPEEEAEEGLLELAAGQAGQGQDDPSSETLAEELKIWAAEFTKTSSAFHALSSEFFQDRPMDETLHRCISLVQFVEVEAVEAEPSHVESEHSGDVGYDRDQRLGSYLQFVFWDFPSSWTGRRLRVEQGRFVWRAPARIVDGTTPDNMTDLFSRGLAKVVLHDCKAALLKARGQFRTNVPPNVLQVYQTLLAVTGCADECGAELGACFLCKGAVEYKCPTCRLWSHDECCSNFEAAMVYQSFCSHTSDRTGETIESLSHFELSEERFEWRSRIGPLTQASCALCCAAVTAHGELGRS